MRIIIAASILAMLAAGVSLAKAEVPPGGPVR